MSNKKWVSGEIVEHHSDLVKKWHAQGWGRRKCAAHLAEETGRSCSAAVMEIVFQKLELKAINKFPTAAIDIRDQGPTSESEEVSIEELIQSRVKASKRKKKKFNRHKRKLELPAEPTGLMILGDPHVDNDGCDWEKIFEDVKLAQSTEGVLMACVGDMQDNWIGRLSKLYSNSSITASDGWRLSEWLLNSMQWIAIVGGNHDSWAHGPGVDPMQWLTKQCGVMCYAPDEIRMTLTWRDRPDLEPIIWILRHDFGGRSWYHPTHGPNKEAMLDGKCHLLTAGHIHQWGQLTTEQRHSRVTHAVRVRGYKRNDSFAIQKGFFEQTYGEAALIVLDPELEGPGRIKIFWDLEEGCKYLTYLRASSSVG